MAEWRIPGLAMAVVRRDEPPLLRSWGVRDIDSGASVTLDTVFPICSVTESLTATALTLLADEGRLDWDAPVRAVLPEFRLRDAVATEQQHQLAAVHSMTSSARARIEGGTVRP